MSGFGLLVIQTVWYTEDPEFRSVTMRTNHMLAYGFNASFPGSSFSNFLGQPEARDFLFFFTGKAKHSPKTNTSHT